MTTIETLKKLSALKYSELKTICLALRIKVEIEEGKKKPTRQSMVNQILAVMMDNSLPSNWFESALMGFDPYLIDEIERRKKIRDSSVFSPVPMADSKQMTLDKHLVKKIDNLSINDDM